MRTLHILLAALAMVSPPTAVIAADGVASANARWNITPPANSTQRPSWSSPVATSAAGTKRDAQRVLGHAFSQPRRYSTATEWVTRAAIFALSATGNINGGGRDDTADIGKRPLPMPNQEASSFGSFSGRIR